MKKAVVIIPTYNEKDNIPIVIPALDQVFKKIKNWDMSILVVDDTSPDKTYEAVEKIQKKYTFVYLLLNKKKAGLGGAYLKGMDYAYNKMNADVAFEFDADMSHDPKILPLFLKKIDEGYDLVLGSRYIKGGSIPENWGLKRKFLSVVGNITIMTVLSDFRIRDWTTGYRAIKKAVYQDVRDQLNNDRFTGYTFQIGFLHKTVRKGYKVAEVPLKFVDRTLGHSKLGNEYIKNTLIYIMKVRIDEILNNRIFKFAFVGGVGALVQLISLSIYRSLFPYQLAFFAAIETAVLSNFILNNIWTFSDRQLKSNQYLSKFIQFNFASAGSIIIQQIVAIIGQFAIGLFALFTLPMINIIIDTGMVYAIVGILIGMFWNFFAYTKFIWKKK